MKILFINCLLLFAYHSYAQNFVQPDGEYMDTTTKVNATCKEYNAYYYQVTLYEVELAMKEPK